MKRLLQLISAFLLIAILCGCGSVEEGADHAMDVIETQAGNVTTAMTEVAGTAQNISDVVTGSTPEPTPTMGPLVICFTPPDMSVMFFNVLIPVTLADGTTGDITLFQGSIEYLMLSRADGTTVNEYILSDGKMHIPFADVPTFQYLRSTQCGPYYQLGLPPTIVVP